MRILGPVIQAGPSSCSALKPSERPDPCLFHVRNRWYGPCYWRQEVAPDIADRETKHSREMTTVPDIDWQLMGRRVPV